MLALTYISILAILFAVILVVVLRPLATKLNLVDEPNVRKVHTGNIPLVGGPVIWLVVTFGVVVFIPNPPWSAILSATLLLILGIIDDRDPIPAVVKLIFHVVAACIVVVGENLAISYIGVFYEVYESRDFFSIQFVLAVIAITASINAFNMIDGIDGLAASMALLALIHTLISFDIIHGGAPANYDTFAFLFAGALAGFLMFNLNIFNSRKVFLGDSGSMLIGLMIAIALIGASQDSSQLTQGPNIPPVLCLWILAIPITDMTTIVFRRLASGKSPLAPDRTHLHHKIMEIGFSSRRTLLVLILSAIGAFWIGYYLTVELSELVGLICFIIFIPSFYYYIQWFCRFFAARWL